MMIEVPDEVGLRLQEMADDQGWSVVELLRNWTMRMPRKRYATLADMAKNADEAGLGRGRPTDTSARSREILHTEFADYITRNWEK